MIVLQRYDKRQRYVASIFRYNIVNGVVQWINIMAIHFTPILYDVICFNIFTIFYPTHFQHYIRFWTQSELLVYIYVPVMLITSVCMYFIRKGYNLIFWLYLILLNNYINLLHLNWNKIINRFNVLAVCWISKSVNGIWITYK